MLNWGRDHRGRRGGLVAGLDVGSTKVFCAIGQVTGKGELDVLGIGQHSSAGVKSGLIIDMEECVTSIVNAVHMAEKMAGVTIQDVIVSVNGSHLQSVNLSVEMGVSGHPVNNGDVRKILTQARVSQENQAFQTLHMVPTSYALDETRGVRDPRGMHGDRLKVSIYALLSKVSPIYNLSTCVARSHLEISSFVAAPYASGLAALVEDEMELGVILIDMGGSTTSFAVFHEGQLRHAECIPVGGQHVTMDIARGFSTTLSHAERLKTLYGSATSSVADDREMITVPLVGERRGDSVNQVQRSALVSIIKPRVEETFEFVKGRLLKIGGNVFLGGRIVLTGGASQLAGVREIASMSLGRNVRLGKPLHLGASELSQNPAFSTCAGLLFYGQQTRKSHLQTLSMKNSKMALQQVTSFLRKIW